MSGFMDDWTVDGKIRQDRFGELFQIHRDGREQEFKVRADALPDFAFPPIQGDVKPPGPVRFLRRTHPGKLFL